MIGILAALVPIADAGTVYTWATPTDNTPSKKAFVTCPTGGGEATGGGAQVFVRGITGDFPPGQLGRISIVQVIPTRGGDGQGLAATGYAARAIAEPSFKEPWHLTVYVVCTVPPPTPNP